MNTNAVHCYLCNGTETFLLPVQQYRGLNLVGVLEQELFKF
jgi:hypothetical protein